MSVTSAALGAARAASCPRGSSNGTSCSRTASFMNGGTVFRAAAAKTTTTRGGRTTLRVLAKDVDPESLMILQQRLGQKITLEGQGFAGEAKANQLNQMNKSSTGLVGLDGRSLADGKKIVKNENSLEITNDPENLFKDVDEVESSMLIDKRLAVRKAKMEAEMAAKAKEDWLKNRAELEATRAARVLPSAEDPSSIVKYFFETEINEMEYEIVRCRPLLTDAFFAHMTSTMATEADENERGKFEALFKVTADFVGFVDKTAKSLAAPKDRLRKLLEAKDKKAMILEMVDKDELDLNLMALLKTNINTAKENKLLREAEFMEKIYNACSKFVDM